MRAQIIRVFEDAGARGFMHARAVDGDDEFGLDADEPVALASVFKICVLVELARQVGAGALSWTQRVHVPANRRTQGPTGLSVMMDDAEVSLRDLAFWMMSVSDNTATDVTMELLGGADPVNATMKQLGLVETELIGDCLFLLDDLGAQLGLSEGVIALAQLSDEVLRACAALAPSGTSRSTPREITALLSLIWRDEAAAPADCAEIRRIMALQVWPHRLTSGFPDGVTISAKTGTLPGIRNEAGVIQTAAGQRFAVAVFTRAETFNSRQPAIDTAIGRAAYLALRSFKQI